MWYDILKIKQIVTPTTKISQRKEPKEEDKCCEEAKRRYKSEYMHMWYPDATPEEKIKEYNNMFGSRDRSYGLAEDLSCEKFRSFLKRNELYFMGRILDAWEECENELV